MTIDDRLTEHYRDLPDMTYERTRLSSFIQDLDAKPGTAPVPVRTARWRMAAAAAGVAVVIITTVGVFSNHGEPAPTVAGSSTAALAPEPTYTGTWTAVWAGSNSDGDDITGWVQDDYLNSIQMVGTSPEQVGAWQTMSGFGERHYASIMPVHARADQASTIIGYFGVGSFGFMHLGSPNAPACPNPTAIGVVLGPATTARGADSPIAAARTIQTAYGIAYFGTATSNWTADQTGDTASITDGPTTLTATATGVDHTWLLRTGKTCFA